MPKKLFLCITLILFVLSASVGTGEQFSSNSEAESQSSLILDHQILLKRQPRVRFPQPTPKSKASIKSLPSLNTAKTRSHSGGLD